MQDVKWI